MNNLRAELEVSYNAVKGYLHAMELGYFIFRIPPFHQRIARAIKKERKAYFFDWMRAESPPAQFENFIAVSLLSLITLWNDRGFGRYELWYLRTRDGDETDFLLTYNQRPWLLMEAKLSEKTIARHHLAHARQLGNIPFVQIIAADGVTERGGKNHWVVSASRLLSGWN